MSRSWREWNKHKFEFHKDGNVVLRRENKKRKSSVAHCCKMHHSSDARVYDELRDLREGKREHLKQIDKAIKGGYAHETAN